MNTFGIAILILWLVSGILTLVVSDGGVPKISYALCWIVLMTQLIDNYLIN